jgi:hypothetical protein
MAKNRLRVKGRADRGSFVALPHEILNHPNFTGLDSHAVKMLIDLYSQYRGKNNGDFSATWSRMKGRGWHSKGTLNRALKELLSKGWIITSRQGWRNHCSLYAVTFKPVDECGGKLDESATLTPLGYWKTGLPN